MAQDMNAAIEQILVTISFCRKVNIPFVLYGFGNDLSGFMREHKLDEVCSSFECKNYNLVFSNVCLREYINSSMSSTEFNQAFKNLLLLSTQYCSDSTKTHGSWGLPATERLSNTPLIQAMVAMKEITEKFRAKHRLDIVNMVLVHDGDADTIRYFLNDNRHGVVESSTCNTILRDPKTKFEMQLDFENNDSLRAAIFEWYTQTTGAKVIGFFLTDLSRPLAFSSIMSNMFVDESGNTARDFLKYNEKKQNRIEEWKLLVKKYRKQIKNEKFLELTRQGYTKFFLIPSGDDLAIEDDELQIQGPVTNNKLLTAFKNLNKDKKNNRILVGKFIKEVA
jgi:hypothetical protein